MAHERPARLEDGARLRQLVERPRVLEAVEQRAHERLRPAVVGLRRCTESRARRRDRRLTASSRARCGSRPRTRRASRSPSAPRRRRAAASRYGREDPPRPGRARRSARASPTPAPAADRTSSPGGRYDRPCVSASMPGVTRTSTRFTPAAARALGLVRRVDHDQTRRLGCRTQLLVRLVVAVHTIASRRMPARRAYASSPSVETSAPMPSSANSTQDGDVRERLHAVEDVSVAGAPPCTPAPARAASARSRRRAASRTRPRARTPRARRAAIRRPRPPPNRERAAAPT